MLINHVLVTTDLSEQAMLSLPHAAAMARLCGGRVTVLFANEWAEVDPTWRIQERDRRLEDVRGLLEAMGAETRVDVVDGSPEAVIESYVADTSVDLVVCTHHASTVRSPLRTSVTQRLVRDALCPTLVVHGPSTRDATVDVMPARYGRIAVASDFSEPSDRGMRAAADFARQLDARLLAIHVVVTRGVSVLDGDVVVLPEIPAEREAEVQTAKQDLKKQIGALYDGRIDTSVVCAPSPAEGVVAAALANRCEMIIVPSHGKGAVKTLFIGSTARKVLDISPLPVLVLRRGADARSV